MMQSTDSWKGLNLAFSLRANFCRPTCWRVFREAEMCPVLMVIEQVRRHQPFEMPLMQEEMPERRDHGKKLTGKA